LKTIDELEWVLGVLALGICLGFFMYLYNHEKERKKEIRKTGSDKDSIG
jgi:hypothetical protein